MKYIKIILVLIIMTSCGHKSQTYYKIMEIKNTPYIVDVPANMYIYASENKMLKMFRDESATGLAIICTPMSVKEFQNKARQEINRDEKSFSVKINVFSDSLIWYSFSKGKVTGNCIYSLKKSPYLNSVLTDEKIFIWYHGLGVTMDKAQTIINSVRVNITDGVDDLTPSNQENLKTYSNNHFSVSYPHEWSYIIENPSDMTEVLIRSEQIDAGLSIVRIETDETLEALVQMAVESNDNLHMQTTIPEKTTISDCMAYKYETCGIFGTDSVKHIAYSLKKDNVFYNLRIGMRPDWINTHQTLINEIASSFTIKEDY